METIEGDVEFLFADLPVQSDEEYWYFKIWNGTVDHCVIVERKNAILYNKCFTALVANRDRNSSLPKFTAKVDYSGKMMFPGSGPCLEYILANDVTFLDE